MVARHLPKSESDNACSKQYGVNRHQPPASHQTASGRVLGLPTWNLCLFCCISLDINERRALLSAAAAAARRNAIMVHGSVACLFLLLWLTVGGPEEGKKASTCSKNILHVHSTMQRTPTVLLSVTSSASTSFTITDHEDSIYPLELECNSHSNEKARKANTGFTYLINDTKLSYRAGSNYWYAYCCSLYVKKEIFNWCKQCTNRKLSCPSTPHRSSFFDFVLLEKNGEA